MNEKDNPRLKILKSTLMRSASHTKVLRNFQDIFDQQLSVLTGAGINVFHQNFTSSLGRYQVITCLKFNVKDKLVLK